MLFNLQFCSGSWDRQEAGAGTERGGRGEGKRDYDWFGVANVNAFESA